MEKKLIILSEWKGKTEFQKLKSNVENHIDEVSSFHYLLCLKNAKMIEEVPKIPSVDYYTKKDFSLFGKVKNPTLKDLLTEEGNSILVVAVETPFSLLNKTIKNSKLMSIGIEMEILPKFDLSFKDSKLEQGNFFKQINNYLTKIQL